MDPIQVSLSIIQNSLTTLGEQVNLLEQHVGANKDNVQEFVGWVQQLEKENEYLIDKTDEEPKPTL